MTSTMVPAREPSQMEWSPQELSREQVELLKKTICRGATDTELDLFLAVCRRTGLDPFAKQIHAVRRREKGEGGEWRDSLQPMIGIDGFRLIAERTGRYVPGREPVIEFDKEGRPIKATAFVRKLVAGEWHDVAASAYYREYVQMTRDNQPNSMWLKMPCSQLAKCYSPETEVLTEAGFQRFDSVTSRILQVTPFGLEAVESRPFSQEYWGEMVGVHGDMLDFCVTPNHDMITDHGRVEARVLLAMVTHRPVAAIPLVACGADVKPDREYPISDENLRLTGYILADGCHNSHKGFVVSVSRLDKIAALELLAPSRAAVRHARGHESITPARTIRSNFDKMAFRFESERVSAMIDEGKSLSITSVLALSRRQARIMFDAWHQFDGHTNRKTGVRRIYTSRPDHVKAIEVLAVKAGYTVSRVRSRQSDISDRPNFYLTFSDTASVKIRRAMNSRLPIPGLAPEPNVSGEVWCVTVPSGVLVVRRNGFSMVCGNCAESLALRRAFPAELSGLYTPDEMSQAEDPVPARPHADVVTGEVIEEPMPALPPKSSKRAEMEEAYCQLLLEAIEIDCPGDLVERLTLVDIANVPDDRLKATGKELRELVLLRKAEIESEATTQ